MVNFDRALTNPAQPGSQIPHQPNPRRKSHIYNEDVNTVNEIVITQSDCASFCAVTLTL